MANINNVIINRAVRGTMFDKSTNEVLWSIDKIADPSLECGGETVFATDAMGVQIAGFGRSKTATFSGTNALFSMDLMAAQLGSDKEVASSTAKIEVPQFELIKVTDTTKIELSIPEGKTLIDTSVKYIYSTSADKCKQTQYGRAVAATATEFSISGNEIKLPTDAFKVGDRVAVWYSVESEKAQRVVDSATKFAKGGKFILEVLVAEPCDTNKEYYAYLIFGNAKLEDSFTLEFNTEATHGFSINAMQDYCSDENELFELVIAE